MMAGLIFIENSTIFPVDIFALETDDYVFLRGQCNVCFDDSVVYQAGLLFTDFGFMVSLKYLTPIPYSCHF